MSQSWAKSFQVGLVLVALGLLVAGSNGTPDVDAQVGTSTIDSNIAAAYQGPSVVLSGKASDPAGIEAVTAVVQDLATGEYVQDKTGLLGPDPVEFEAWTALVPPPGDPGVVWRVPLSLGDGEYEVTVTASAAGELTVAPVEAITVRQTPPTQLGLILQGAEWSYYDLGELPDPNWAQPDFDDTLWPAGPSKLGFAQADLLTQTASQSPLGEPIITQYFRHTFTGGDLTEHQNPVLYVKRDDGAVVYLNGVEIFRGNMAPDPVEYSTYALSSQDRVDAIAVDIADIAEGENVLAVEVHQTTPFGFGFGGDLGFDAALYLEPKVEGFVTTDNREGTYVLTAGDMAKCSFEGDEAVAEQMAGLWQADAGVFVGLGDLVYNSGTVNEFANCYAPTIGQFKDVTWPNAGNHEHYTTPNAAGYRQYFGEAAGPTAGPDGGLWYTFDIDDHWTLIALDSDCEGREVLPGAIDGDGCAVGSEQEAWLRATLEEHKDRNLIAFFHHPPYTNNHYTDHEYTWPLWRALAEYGVDITLHGHEHHYERYAPLDYWGERDETHGVREFIIGSGGTQPRYLTRPQEPTSDFRGVFPDGTFDFGVLQLWLRPDGYDWKWEPIGGLAETDEGSGGLSTPMPLSDISGTVTNEVAAVGVEGVEVCATATRSAVVTCSTTDVDGAYRLERMVSDSYQITTAPLDGLVSDDQTQDHAAPQQAIVNFAIAANPGDVNCDQNYNVVDALVIAQYSVGNRTGVEVCPLPVPETEIYVPSADFNADGMVNIVDSLLIAQCSVSVVNEFCA